MNPASDENVNILMVDDQPARLRSYEAVLSELGANLISATSGGEALEVLLKTDVAVLLTDVKLSDGNGLELAERIHQDPRLQRTAIIFVSAVHLSDLDRLNAYRRGAVDYISVPVVPELLRAKVSLFAELHRKTRQLEAFNRELEQRVRERTEELQHRAGEIRKLNRELQQRVLELETSIDNRNEMELMLQQRVSLLDLASETIMVHDMDGILSFWNSGAESLYGWRRDEVLGRNVHTLLETKFPVAFEDIKSSLLSEGRWEGNLVHTTRTGREVVVASRFALQTGLARQPAILQINRDITGQLEAEEALRRSEKLAAMGRMAGIIAHEINNPLESVTNLFYLIQTHPSLDDEARAWAQTAERELERIGHITRQTLSFYRDWKLAAPVSILGVLDNVLELQGRQLQRNGIALDKQYDCDGVVQGVAVELRQVFLNLIGNAVQAMPQGGRLRLHVHECGEADAARRGIRVSIVDTGFGISPEDAGHVFEPFFSTKAAKGTGLGLWISKGIVEKYEGTIRFRSMKLGSGQLTCFSVFLPAASSNERTLPVADDSTVLDKKAVA